MNNEYRYLGICEKDDLSQYTLYFYDFPECKAKANDIFTCIDNAKDELGLHLWKLTQNKSIIPKATDINDIEMDKIEETQIIVIVVLEIDDFKQFHLKMLNKNFDKDLEIKTTDFFTDFIKTRGCEFRNDNIERNKDFVNEHLKTTFLELKNVYKEIVKYDVRDMLYITNDNVAIVEKFPGYTLNEIEEIRRKEEERCAMIKRLEEENYRI